MLPVTHNTLLHQQRIQVSDEGETVAISFGNFARSFNYEVTFILGWKLARASRAAKAMINEKRFGLMVTGQLHDASHKLGPDAHQPFTANRVFSVNRDLTPLDRIDARAVSKGMVVLTIRPVDVRLDYQAALQISQWIRMHAKNCKRRAEPNERRHWSDIGREYAREKGIEG